MVSCRLKRHEMRPSPLSAASGDAKAELEPLSLRFSGRALTRQQQSFAISPSSSFNASRRRHERRTVVASERLREDGIGQRASAGVDWSDERCGARPADRFDDPAWSGRRRLIDRTTGKQNGEITCGTPPSRARTGRPGQDGGVPTRVRCFNLAGSASVVGQAASGLILMYSSAFRVGDYVKINDNEGTISKIGTA
jgi:hypothetical protein